jgi:hypothetical protein
LKDLSSRPSRRIVIRETYNRVNIRFRIWAAGRLELCNLDLGPLHSPAEEGLSTKEEFVIVATAIVAFSKPLESIHVESLRRALDAPALSRGGHAVLISQDTAEGI